MLLELKESEVAALKEALDRYLPTLEFELSRIKLMRDRHDLVELDDALRSVRERLEAARPGAQPGG